MEDATATRRPEAARVQLSGEALRLAQSKSPTGFDSPIFELPISLDIGGATTGKCGMSQTSALRARPGAA
jgi:hypothetical protein